MTPLDRTSLNRILPSTSGSADWEDVLRRSGARHGGRDPRLVALAAAVLVVVLGTASAFGTVRDIFSEGQGHVYVGMFQVTGKRGSLQIQLQFPAADTRSWVVVRGTGQYAQVTGGGRISQVGGRARAWTARLHGFVASAEAAKQRVSITMKGRPNGAFVLSPLEPGLLRRDSGTQWSFWMG